MARDARYDKLPIMTTRFSARAMAGFDKAKARDAFGIPEDLDIIEVIAVGWPGDAQELPEALREQEFPKPRMSADKLVL